MKLFRRKNKEVIVKGMDLRQFAKVDANGNFLIEAIPVANSKAKTIFNIGTKYKIARKFEDIKEIWFINADGVQMVFENEYFLDENFEHKQFFKKLFEATVKFMFDEQEIKSEIDRINSLGEKDE